MTNSDDIAWLNGRIIPFADAALPVWDLGVVAGASISEMARTYRHQPFRLTAHLERLTESCADIGFRPEWPGNELHDVTSEVVAHNAAHIDNDSDLGIVAFVTAGPNPTYSAPVDAIGCTVCVHTFELPFDRWNNSVQHGVSLTVPDRRQLPRDSFPVLHKTRNRLHWWIADREAANMRPGSRALLLDENDQITETSSACFFAVIDGVVVTPRRGVLRSLSRQLVQDTCDRRGIRFRADDIPVSRIADFQEVFLSSTPCGLLPVVSIDDHSFPGRSDGTIMQQLQQEWTRVTGVDTFQQIQSRSSD